MNEKQDELHARLVGFFDEAAEVSETYRTRAERDRDYYDGIQWTPRETAELKTRGQAAIVVNRIKPKVDFLLGLERQSRTDPRCFPRTPADEGAAEAATQAIRYVLDAGDFDQSRSQVFEHLLIEGAGFAEVVAEAGDRIRIHAIPWDRAFIDPHARRRDLEDARYRGQVVWMELSDAITKYPDHTELLEAAMQRQTSSGDTYDDKPDHWADKKRRRVRVVECWYKEGSDVYRAVFCRGGLLEEPAKSPYTDADGVPEDPYVFAAAFLTREGEKYGAVRQLIGIQDEINKRRSKALHLLSVRQVRAEKGSVEDVAQARRELARPDGWIETVPGFEFEVLPTGDMAQAQFNLLAEAKGEIDTVGAHDVLSGKAGDKQSGRAIQARQQGGRVEMGPLFDTLRGWQMRVYRKVWRRVRQFWTEERWIRITDDARSLQWVGLNRPVTLAEELKKRFGHIPPEMQNDPRLSEVTRIEHPVATLDVDITVGEAPDTVAIRQEEFRTLASLAQSGIAIPPTALIEASGLHDKEKILNAMKSDPEQANLTRQQQRLQVESLIHQIHERHAKAKKTEVEAEVLARKLGG